MDRLVNANQFTATDADYTRHVTADAKSKFPA